MLLEVEASSLLGLTTWMAFALANASAALRADRLHLYLSAAARPCLCLTPEQELGHGSVGCGWLWTHAGRLCMLRCRQESVAPLEQSHGKRKQGSNAGPVGSARGCPAAEDDALPQRGRLMQLRPRLQASSGRHSSWSSRQVPVSIELWPQDCCSSLRDVRR